MDNEELKENTLRRLARIEFLVRVHTRALGRCALQKSFGIQPVFAKSCHG